MSARQDDLRVHREWLTSRAAAQRSEVAALTADLQQRLQWVDRGFAVGKALRNHPLLAATGASLLLRRTKSKRLLRVGQLFTAWELFSLVRKQWPRRQA